MILIQRLRAYFLAASPDIPFEIIPFAQGDAILPELAHTAGGQTSFRTPVLACTAQTFRPAPVIPGLEFVIISSLSSLADVQENFHTNGRGFDPLAAPAPTAEVEAFRAGLITSRAFTARLDNQPAAAGMYNPPVDGVAELAGITTLEAYRRRGIAAALTSEMVRAAFENNIDTPILMTDNPEAYRVYQRIGFYPAALLIKNNPG